MAHEDLTRERQKAYESFIKNATIGSAAVAVILFILVVWIIA